jgi:acyl carrier protein
MTRTDVIGSLAAMITDVIGDDHLGIAADTSFRDELAFQSIHFVALAELIQERWTELDFVAWLGTMEVTDVVAMRVGDVADFIVGAGA